MIVIEEPGQRFTYASHAQKVVSASGVLRTVEAEAEILGSKRALVFCAWEQRDLGERVTDA
jgi:hypothetical protein